MLKRFIATGVTSIRLWAVVAGSVTQGGPLQHDKPTLQKSSLADADRSQLMQTMLVAAVRLELLTLPYYDGFDWLGAEILSDGRVVLRGEVVRPTTSDDAENRVRRIESVSGVVNEIKVLSLRRGIANFGSRFIGPFTIGIRLWVANSKLGQKPPS